MGTYPNRIHELRGERGLSQQALADLVGCSKMQISGLERGRPVLDTTWMRRISEAFGVHPADLLSDEDNPMRLSAEERRLIQQVRSAAPEVRETLHRVTEAVIPYKARDAA